MLRHSRTSPGSSWIDRELFEHVLSASRRRASCRSCASTAGSAWSNSTSASCFGELTLNSLPACAKMRRLRSSKLVCIAWPSARSAAASTLIPALLDADEHGDQRTARAPIDRVSASRVEIGREPVGDRQREVGALGGEGRERARRHGIEGNGLDPSALHVLGGGGPVVGAGQHERRQIMVRPGGIQQIAGDHRVQVESPERDPFGGGGNRRELEVVADLPNRRIGEGSDPGARGRPGRAGSGCRPARCVRGARSGPVRGRSTAQPTIGAPAAVAVPIAATPSRPAARASAASRSSSSSAVTTV